MPINVVVNAHFCLYVKLKVILMSLTRSFSDSVQHK